MACGWHDSPGGSKWIAREETQLLDVLHNTYLPTYTHPPYMCDSDMNVAIRSSRRRSSRRGRGSGDELEGQRKCSMLDIAS